jgi:hypothetical protein
VTFVIFLELEERHPGFVVWPTLRFTSVEDASLPTSFAADDTALTAFLAAGAAVCGEGDPQPRRGLSPVRATGAVAWMSSTR